MHEVRLLTAVELGDLLNRCEVGNRVAAAALHRDRRDAQTCGFYFRAVIVDLCCDDDIRPGFFQGNTQREPMRTEIPILADEVDDLPTGERHAQRSNQAWACNKPQMPC